jgi:hypothetical protein
MGDNPYMQDLISTDCPLYGKRLVREIRDTLNRGHGVYFNSMILPSNPRIFRASFSTKTGSIICWTSIGRQSYASGFWDRFSDGATGKDIYAGRSPR